MPPALLDPSERPEEAAALHLRDEGCDGASAFGDESDADTWHVRGSAACLRVENPIRKIVDSLRPDPNSTRPLISLAQGDPTAYGHLRAPEGAVEAVVEAIRSGKANGYQHSLGAPDARCAVAEFFSPEFGSPPIDPSADVILTVGCNQALEVALRSLCDPAARANVLVPRPGYPIYDNYLAALGAEPRYYDLRPDSGWEVDLPNMQALCDSNTRAAIICNPGNPSGCVYERKHLEEILAVAGRLRLPLIADEVYSSFVFEGRSFVRMASLGGPVPIITVDSISKRFLVPGWRLGWLIITDRNKILERGKVVEAMRRQMAFSPTPNSAVMAATRTILHGTPPEFGPSVVRQLEEAAALCSSHVRGVPGISCPSMPRGSMFLMVKIDLASFGGAFEDDVAWCAALLKEEAVVVIPGAAFKFPGYFRLMFALPVRELEEAWNRIEAFCRRHHVGEAN